jgi:hypothetical protein
MITPDAPMQNARIRKPGYLTGLASSYVSVEICFNSPGLT